MPNPGTPAYGLPPAEDDQQRRQADLKRRQREDAAARTLESAEIGSGGLTVTGGFVDLKAGSTLHVSGDAVFDGTLTLPAGSLDTPGGSISAGVDVSAGQDVSAGRDVNAVRDIAAGHDLSADHNLTVGADATISGTLSTGSIGAGGNVSSSGSVSAAGNVTAAGVVVSPGSRAYVVSVSYAGAWIDGDGTLGISPSSRRFKTDIVPWETSIERLLELRSVMFRYTFAAADSPKQLGFIAEEMEELGFTEFLFYDLDGRVEGVNYDRVVVALLELAKAQETRLRAIEQHLGL